MASITMPLFKSRLRAFRGRRLRGAAIACCAFGLLALGQAASAEAPPLSALGRQAMGFLPPAPASRTTPAFVFFAPTPAVAEEAAALGEFAWRELGAALGLPPAPAGGAVILLADPESWRGLLRQGGLRPDAQAFQYRQEICLLWTGNAVSNTARLAFELAHLRVGQVCGARSPLWLDEGLCGYLSWDITQRYYALQHRRLTLSRPAVAPRNKLSLADVLACRTPPDDPVAARAFFRQAEELVRALVRRFGQDRLVEFLQALCDTSTTLEDLLRARFQYGAEDWAGLEGEMQAAAQRARGP